MKKYIIRKKKSVVESKQQNNANTKTLNEIKVFKKTDMSLNEMARINKKETEKGLFPYNKWEIKIWSNDHTPPHFHIIADGWNVSFRIDNGEVLDIETEGNKNSIYDYMIQNVNEWLESTCAILPQITNRQNAQAQWEQIHDN